MSKVAAIGDKTCVLGFGALGIDAYIVSKPGEAEEAWKGVLEKDYSVVFVAEQVYEDLKEEVTQISEQLTPAVLVIPGPTGSKGLGFERLKGIVEMAVGADILTERETRI